MGRILIKENRCKGCSLCVPVCPKSILAIGDKINIQGYTCVKILDMDQCSGCTLCALVCPDLVFEVWR